MRYACDLEAQAQVTGGPQSAGRLELLLGHDVHDHAAVVELEHNSLVGRSAT